MKYVRNLRKTSLGWLTFLEKLKTAEIVQIFPCILKNVWLFKTIFAAIFRNMYFCVLKATVLLTQIVQIVLNVITVNLGQKNEGDMGH